MLRRRWVLPLAAWATACAPACVGDIGSGGGAVPKDSLSQETLSEIGPSGLRRLTSFEYDTTVRDLLGVDSTQAAQYLPEDLRTPFDNDFTIQTASQALIDGADLLSAELAAAVIAEPALRKELVPCEPAGPDDEACFREFVATFGRRALRRSLVAAEVDRFAIFMDHAAQASDFWVAVDSAVRALLQHPELYYRVEIGTEIANDPDVRRLTDLELAARLSYFLWGTTPSDWLLDAAETGVLSTPDGVRGVVEQMLGEDRARARIGRFHSMWLSYETLPHGAELSTAMQLETASLLERVIFDEQTPWADLLRSEETFLTPALAEHYGLPAPSPPEGDWVSYGDSGRQGLLSQGSFLSAVAKFDDTSPTQRGLLIRTRLFCQVINTPPPDLMVNTDEPPEGPDPNACKSEKYSMWKTDGCSMCHSLMDPVGFGLENFDSAGRYRAFEPDRPDCPIDGAGKLEGVGSFTGPAELSDLILETGEIDACVSTQLYRFAMGRFDLEKHDRALLERLADARGEGVELRFDQLVLELTSADAFRHRREEAAK